MDVNLINVHLMGIYLKRACHRRAPHGRVPHGRTPHGRAPHRRVSHGRVYSRSPTLQTVVHAVVDLSRSELQNSVGAAVRLARRTHAFAIGKRQVTAKNDPPESPRGVFFAPFSPTLDRGLINAHYTKFGQREL